MSTNVAPGAGVAERQPVPEEAIRDPEQPDEEMSPAEIATLLGARIGQQAMAAHMQAEEAIMAQRQQVHQAIDLSAAQEIEAMQRAVVEGAQLGAGVASGPQAVGNEGIA